MASGDLPIGGRVERMEDIHAPGGPCERDKKTFWQEIDGLKKAITDLRLSLARLEVKIVIVIALAQFIVTALIQIGIALWTGRAG